MERARDDLRRDATLLSGGAEDYDPLLEAIGDARFVLLGEASHGTHEFYGQRAERFPELPTEEVPETFPSTL